MYRGAGIIRDQDGDFRVWGNRAAPDLDGSRACAVFFHAVVPAGPELHIEVRSEYQIPGCTIREVVITGTQNGDSADIRPLGSKVSIEKAAFCTFDAPSGKLVSERIFYDQADTPALMQAKKPRQFPKWPSRNRLANSDSPGLSEFRLKKPYLVMRDLLWTGF